FSELLQNWKSHFIGPVVKDTFLPAISLDRTSPAPLQQQIYSQIAQAIRDDVIGSGALLPSSRWLARLLGVSRNTMLAAYDVLAAKGRLRGGRGSGMRGTRAASGPLALHRAIRESGYPARTLGLRDPDGNPLYINHAGRSW